MILQFAQASLQCQDGRKRIVEPAVLATSSHESLSIVVSLMQKCISPDASRPSFEDILWNLQYAAQVQATADSDQRSESASYQWLLFFAQLFFKWYGNLIAVCLGEICWSITRFNMLERVMWNKKWASSLAVLSYTSFLSHISNCNINVFACIIMCHNFFLILQN